MRSFAYACALAGALAACSGGDDPVTAIDAPTDVDAATTDAAAADAATIDAPVADAAPLDGRPTFDGGMPDGLLPTDCTLVVERVGLGSGTVTSSPAGIACGSVCRATLPCGSAITLTAIPAPGSRFVAWGVGCTAGGPTCTLTVAQPVTVVTANFTTGP